MTREWLLLGTGLLVLGAQVVLIYHGPVTVTQRGEETVYTPQYLYALLLNGLVLAAGARFAWRHFRVYGWRRTFRTETGGWDAGMRTSFAGALLLVAGVVTLGLTLWGMGEGEYLTVSPAGFTHGADGWAGQDPPTEVHFRDLQSIDFEYRKKPAGRGKAVRYLRCADHSGGERLIERKSLVNAAAGQIAEEAGRAGVTLVNE
jgi:hypothetical protein